MLSLTGTDVSEQSIRNAQQLQACDMDWSHLAQIGLAVKPDVKNWCAHSIPRFRTYSRRVVWTIKLSTFPPSDNMGRFTCLKIRYGKKRFVCSLSFRGERPKGW